MIHTAPKPDPNVAKMCSNEQLYVHKHWVQVILFCLYATIFIVGVGGNLVVIGVILGNKQMRTTINLYLLNLSTSDIIMSVFSSAKLMGRWQFIGGGMCKLTISSMIVSVCMSTFTLAAIAVNRFLAVFYPFSTRNHSVTRTIVIILCIDLVAIIITLPRAIVVEQVTRTWLGPELKFKGNIVCSSSWSEKSHRVHNLFVKISEFAIPFTIIVICYTSIMIKLKHRDQIRRSESMTTEQMQEEASRNKRMNKMLITITVLFGICWFPSRLLQMVWTVDHSVRCWKLWKLTEYTVHVIAMFSTCFNPFLYGFMNTAFKEAFAKLWSCARKTEAMKNRERENDSGFVEERVSIEECTTSSTGLSQSKIVHGVYY